VAGEKWEVGGSSQFRLAFTGGKVEKGQVW
jgi:hypothetical protein